MKIGFFGVGHMGGPMAANLVNEDLWEQVILHGDAAWNPGAPWEGLVSSFELHASNRPAAVDWSKRESRRSLTELHSWIFQLAWR